MLTKKHLVLIVLAGAVFIIGAVIANIDALGPSGDAIGLLVMLAAFFVPAYKKIFARR